MEENSRKKKEIHKLSLFSKVVIGLILATFLCCLISIPFIIKSRKLSEQAVNVVKEMRIVEGSDMTIGEAFDRYFSNTRWYATEDDNEFDVVFTGYGMFDGKEQYVYCRFMGQNAEFDAKYIFVGDKGRVFNPDLLQGDEVYFGDQETFFRTIAELAAE